MTFTLDRPKRRKHEEASMQEVLVRDLRLLLPKGAFVFHCPNGGERNPLEAARLKRQGVVAGIPDLLIVHAGRVCGLELKSRGGRLSDEQRNVIDILRNAGMRVEIARSHGEALDRIREMGIPLRIKGDGPCLAAAITHSTDAALHPVITRSAS